MIVSVKMTRAENVDYYGVKNGDSVRLDLEEYLRGVLPSEITESRTPMAAKKAQAIASRSFALFRALGGGLLDDTSASQNYRVSLVDGSPLCAAAVADTNGLALMYGGKVIECVYSASNDGRTLRSDERWKTALPYYVNREDPWNAAGRAMFAAQGRTVRNGHGVGLSQVGAEYAAAQGEDCGSILAFYYPGAGVCPYETEGKNMATKPKASAVCATSIACARKQPPIEYVWGMENATKQDCQGHIEYCVRENGGSMSYAGSNDMFRNACSWVGTIAEAKAKGYYDIPGTLMFQVKAGGDYPAKYHGDGRGNAQHVGFRINLQGIEIVHAVSSAGKVTTGTMNNAWTHMALAKAIDYSEYLSAAGDAPAVVDVPAPVPAGETTGIVTAGGSGLNMRKAPGGEYMLKIPTNAVIEISETTTHNGERWGKTQWPNAKGQLFAGWVHMAYVALRREDPVPEAVALSVVIPCADQAAAAHLMGLYPGAYLMEVVG